MKWILSILGVIMVSMFLVVLAGEVIARNGFPDYLAMWFPEYFAEKDFTDVTKTGAPFRDAPEQDYSIRLENTGEVLDLPHEYDAQPNSTALDVPHRLETQVAAWLQDYVAKALNVSPGQYDEHIEELSDFMNPAAVQNYKDFMEASNIRSTMQDSQLELRSIIEEVPELRNTGVLSGRFRWLYDIRVQLSFIPVGLKSYEDVKPVNELVRVRVQVGRVAGGGADGMEIESWDVKQR